jgi:protein-disulfide isomerase
MLRIPSVAVLAFACAATATACEQKSSDEKRLALLEKKVDKIIEVLEGVLPGKEPDPAATYSVPIDELDPVEGPANAKVTIVEGYEFACPYCLQAHPIVEQIRQEFPNDVRVVSKYLVVHQPAIPAGLAVCAANKQGKFAEMKNTIWSQAWGPDGRPIMEKLSPDAMAQFATDLGLDVEKFKADMDSDACRGWLDKSQKTLAQVGQSGTPGFYINGKAFGGLVPLDAMRQIVQDELKKADEAIKGGVKQDDFYRVAVVEKGEKKVPGWFDLDEDKKPAKP